jgi:hypothetical protein
MEPQPAEAVVVFGTGSEGGDSDIVMPVAAQVEAVGIGTTAPETTHWVLTTRHVPA